MLEMRYVNDWIVKIIDITDYVKELNELRQNGIDIYEILPDEMIYVIK